MEGPGPTKDLPSPEDAPRTKLQPPGSKEKRGKAGTKAAEMLLWCGTRGTRHSWLGTGLSGWPRGPNKILSLVLTRRDHGRDRTSPNSPRARRALSFSPVSLKATGVAVVAFGAEPAGPFPSLQRWKVSHPGASPASSSADSSSHPLSGTWEPSDTGMQGCEDWGHRDAGTQGCRNAGMQRSRTKGCRDAGMQGLRTEGCRNAGMQRSRTQGGRDAGMQGLRTQGCRDCGRRDAGTQGWRDQGQRDAEMQGLRTQGCRVTGMQR